LINLPSGTGRSLKALVEAHSSDVPIAIRRSSTSNHVVQLRGSLLLKAPQYMAVNVERESNRGVPQSLLNDLWMDTRLEQQRGGGMTQVMEANIVKTGSFAKRPPASPREVLASQCASLGIGKDPRPRVWNPAHPLAVGPEGVDCEVGQVNDPSSLGALGFGNEKLPVAFNDRTTHREGAALQIDVAPAKTKKLSLA
jgi:hypothetical protein